MAKPLLRVESLTFRRGAAIDLAAVSFSVESHSLTAVIGPDPWDKDALVAVLQGRRHPAQGTLRLRSRPITDLSPTNRVRLGLAWTAPLDVYGASSASLIEFVTLAIHAAGAPSPLDFWRRRPSPLCAEEATGLLARVGLGERAEAALDAVGAADRVRLQLALALAPQPRLLMVDRPTGALSAPERRQLAALLHDLAHAGPAVLWVEDDAMLALETADHVVAVVEGRALVPSAAGREASEAVLDAAFLGQVR